MPCTSKTGRMLQFYKTIKYQPQGDCKQLLEVASLIKAVMQHLNLWQYVIPEIQELILEFYMPEFIAWSLFAEPMVFKDLPSGMTINLIGEPYFMYTIPGTDRQIIYPMKRQMP